MSHKDKQRIEQEVASVVGEHEAAARTGVKSRHWSPCAEILCIILNKLKLIIAILLNRCFGLPEIKCEIREIEEKLDNLVPPSSQGGAITTGPFLVRTGENNAIGVKIQNAGDATISVTALLYDVGECPPELVSQVGVADLEAGCTAQDITLTADAGDWEVVLCPSPADARIRGFVSVHSGNAVTSAIEYVFRAAEMLPAAAAQCELPID